MDIVDTLKYVRREELRNNQINFSISDEFNYWGKQLVNISALSYITKDIIMDLEKTRTRYSKGIELLIKESKTNDDTLEKLSSILEPHKNGKCPVTIKCVSDNHIVPMKLNNDWCINPTTTIIDNLGDLLGSENIIVKYH